MAARVKERELDADFVRKFIRKWDTAGAIPIKWDEIRVERRPDWAGTDSYYIYIPLQSVDVKDRIDIHQLTHKLDFELGNLVIEQFGIMPYVNYK